MRAVNIALLGIAAALLSPAVQAEIYKWVDARGVTNYSNRVPSNGGSAHIVAEDRISIYRTDARDARALEAAAQQSANLDLAIRMRVLERELGADRGRAFDSSVQQYAAMAQAAYDRCKADRRVDCSEVYGGIAPFAVAGGAPVAPIDAHGRGAGMRSGSIFLSPSVPGVTAGNLTVPGMVQSSPSRVDRATSERLAGAISNRTTTSKRTTTVTRSR
jgi:hypothetical protein